MRNNSNNHLNRRPCLGNLCSRDDSDHGLEERDDKGKGKANTFSIDDELVGISSAEADTVQYEGKGKAEVVDVEEDAARSAKSDETLVLIPSVDTEQRVVDEAEAKEAKKDDA